MTEIPSGTQETLEILYGPNRKESVEPLLESRYKRAVPLLWTSICAHFRINAPPPALEVVYTPVSLPRFFRSDEGGLVVFDQHLGQILNQLSRLLAPGTEWDMVHSYVLKLLAIRSLAGGRLEQAARYAAKFIAYREVVLEGRTNSERPEHTRTRMLSVGVQEDFVLAHELAHYAFGLSGEWATEMVDDYVDEVRHQIHSAGAIDQSAFAEAFVEDHLRMLERRYGRRMSAMELDERLRAVRSLHDLEHDFARLEADALGQLGSDARFQEECLCDLIATLVAAWHGSAAYGLRWDRSVVAAVQAVHNMRLLARINSLAYGDVDDMRNITIESIFRLRFLRTALRSVYAHLSGGSPGLVRGLDKRITEFNVLHTSILGDHVSFWPGDTASKSTEAPPDVGPTVGSFVDDSRHLRRVLGFR